MKKNLVAALLSGTMVFTMTPAEFVFAVENQSETSKDSTASMQNFDKNLMYSVKSSEKAYLKDSDSTAAETYEPNTNIRDKGIVVLDLGEIQADKTSSKAVTLTFEYDEEKAETSKFEKASIFCESDAANFTLSWDSGRVGEVTSSKSAVLTIKLKDNLALGEHKQEPVLLMDLEQRVGWPIYLTYNVKAANRTVKPQATRSKYFGQTLTPKDITYSCVEDGSTGNLEGLGVTGLGEGANAEASVGTYKLSYQDTEHGIYQYHFDGKTELTVERTTPEISNVSVVHDSYGNKLSNYSLEVTYINPFTKEEVKGTAAWDNPNLDVENEQEEFWYTFKPNDSKNYEEVSASVTVVKDGSFDSKGANTKTIFTVDQESLNVTYNKNTVHKLKFSSNRAGAAKITYTNKDNPSEVSTEGVKLAGTYIVNVSIPENTDAAGKHYSAFNGTYTLTVEQAEASPTFYIYDRPYSQDNDLAQISGVATNLGGTVLKSGDVEITTTNVNDYFDARFNSSEIGTHNVQITLKEGVEVHLEGAQARNYKLPENLQASAQAKITTQVVNLKLNSSVKKFYGQSMALVPSDFVATNEKNEPIYLEGLKLTAESEGEKAETEVGQYEISVSIGDEHYQLNPVTDKLTVEPAEPIAASETPVTSGYGTIGQNAESLNSSLKGAFINPYTLKPVAGNVKIADSDKAIELSSSGNTLNYEFEPDNGNHKKITGQFSVENKEGNPVAINILENEFDYDTQAHEVKATAEHAEVISSFASNVSGLTDGKAVNAGSYDVILTADADASIPDITDNVQNTTLIISPVKPEVSVTVSDNLYEKGTKLGQVTPDFTARVGETSVKGTFAWESVDGIEDPAETEIVDGGSYHWTWTPQDTQNLVKVQGVTQINLKSSSTEPDPDEGQQGGNNHHSSGSGGGGGSSSAPSGGSSSTSGNENNEVVEEEPTAPQPDEEIPEESTSETTTTVETPDAKISYTRDETGLVAAYVEITPTAAAAGTAKVEMPAIKASTQSSGAITLEIPQDITEPVSVLIPVENANYGTMALALDANGSETPYPYCYYDGNGSLVVPAGQSFTLVIKNMAKTFSDVPGDPNVYPANTIAFLSARGIMTGKGNGESFAPLENLTRGQLALMLYRLDGQSDQYDNTAVPADVAENEYFARAAKWAVGSALMGQGGSSFNGYAPVTREQMALILYRYNGSTGADQSRLSGYSDSVLASSEEARDAISSLVAQGIMGKGTNSLKPTENATRQDVAAMIARWIQPALTTLK